MNAATADPHGDFPAGLHPLAKAAAENQSADRTRHVVDARLGDRLFDKSQGRKRHGGKVLARCEFPIRAVHRGADFSCSQTHSTLHAMTPVRQLIVGITGSCPATN